MNLILLTSVSVISRQMRGMLLATAAVFAIAAAPAYAAQAPSGQRELTVDSLSVVKVKAQAVRDARSSASLGVEREGTGVVIDTNGLVLTIGYLIAEAEKVELSTADGKVFPATVLGYDTATGMGLLKALTPLPVRPVDFGESAKIGERELVLIVGFDGVAPAYVVSKRPFVGYWEYLLDEAIYTAPATVNWQGAALLSREGKLLGIGSLAVGDALGSQANIPGNMFVPIDVVKPVVGDMVANGKSTAKARPWIGVNTQEVQGNLIVTRVSPESPAEDAGVQKGDVIVGVAGKAIRGQKDFYTKLWATGNAGVDVPLEVLKGNQLQNYTVKSKDRDSYFRPKPVF
ncbi:MAG: serine protease Do [Betaproteobacteria bacterium]